MAFSNTLSQWIKNKLNRGKEVAGNIDADAQPLPFRDDWPTIPASTANSTSYGLFQQLPLEIRRQTLGHAFGNLTLHVDLTFNHPLIRKSASPARPKKTATRGKSSSTTVTPERRTHCGFDSNLVRDTKQPKTWQWFGCVCHRRLVRVEEQDQPCGQPIGRPHWRIEPCDDKCIPGPHVEGKATPSMVRYGSLCMCEDDEGRPGDKCFVGVMGWLLACRQAYLDGINVLYSTNTFHIASLPLLLNLPRLLPPLQLATVTSLELLFNLEEPNTSESEIMTAVWTNALPSSTPSNAAQSTPFHDLCRMIPSTFPNVRRLYIALQAFIGPCTSPRPADVLGEVERVVLGPVEDVFRRLGPAPGKEFSLAVQAGAWRVLAERLTRRDLRVKQYFVDLGDSFEEKLWKPLGEGDGEGQGYWLRTGWDDIGAYGHGYWLFDFWGTGVVGEAF